MKRLTAFVLAIQLAFSQVASSQVRFDSTGQAAVDSALVISRRIAKEIGGCATLRAIGPGRMLLTHVYVAYLSQTETRVTVYCLNQEVIWHTHVTLQRSQEYLCSKDSMKLDELYAVARRLKAGVMICGMGPDSMRIYGSAWDSLLGPIAITQRGT